MVLYIYEIYKTAAATRVSNPPNTPGADATKAPAALEDEAEAGADDALGARDTLLEEEEERARPEGAAA